MAVLEPRVSPAFAISYFCNHFNIRFDPISAKTSNQRSLTPWWPLTPSLLRSHVWLYQRIIVTKSHENTLKYVETVTLFSKTWNQRSLTPRWPLTTCLLRSHVWLYPRIIVSKSHGNTSMYVDTVINFAKKYHILRTYYIHTYTHILRTEWVFRRDKNRLWYTAKLLFHQSLRCTVTTWSLDKWWCSHRC